MEIHRATRAGPAQAYPIAAPSEIPLPSVPEAREAYDNAVFRHEDWHFSHLLILVLSLQAPVAPALPTFEQDFGTLFYLS